MPSISSAASLISSRLVRTWFLRSRSVRRSLTDCTTFFCELSATRVYIAEASPRVSRILSVSEFIRRLVSSRFALAPLPSPSKDMEEVDARRVKALNDSSGQSSVVEELVDRMEVRLLCDGEKVTSIGDVGAGKGPSESLAYCPAMNRMRLRALVQFSLVGMKEEDWSKILYGVLQNQNQKSHSRNWR